MGHGDIKLMRGMGALLGPAMTAVSLVMAVFVGLIVGVALIVAQRGRTGENPMAAPDLGGSRETIDSPVAASQLESRAVSSEASASAAPQDAGEDEIPPESIGSIFKFGVWYLLCLDVVGVFVPSIYKIIGEEIPDAASEEIDDWKPTVTTIPFGPYLAAGCLVCMIFSGPVQRGIDGYFSQFQSAPVPSAR
jgi:leader peptidase (prepilin peptidase)/N-methyltransferase